MMDLEIRVASATDLDRLVCLAATYRDHLRHVRPLDVDFRASIALLLKDAGTEFFLAYGARGTTLGYVQSRYRRRTVHANLRLWRAGIFDMSVFPNSSGENDLD